MNHGLVNHPEYFVGTNRYKHPELGSLEALLRTELTIAKYSLCRSQCSVHLLGSQAFMSSEIYQGDVRFSCVGRIMLDTQPRTNLCYVRDYLATLCVFLS
jgi:hypothetical protein